MFKSRPARSISVFLFGLLVTGSSNTRALGAPEFTDPNLIVESEKKQLVTRDYWLIDDLRREVWSKIQVKPFFSRESPRPILFFDLSSASNGLVLNAKCVGKIKNSAAVEKRVWASIPFKNIPQNAQGEKFEVSVKLTNANYNGTRIDIRKDPNSYSRDVVPELRNICEILRDGDTQCASDLFKRLEASNESNTHFIIVRNFCMKCLVMRDIQPCVGLEEVIASIPNQWLMPETPKAKLVKRAKELTRKCRNIPSSEYFDDCASILLELQAFARKD